MVVVSNFNNMADVSLRQQDSQEYSDYTKEWEQNKKAWLAMTERCAPDLYLLYSTIESSKISVWALIQICRGLIRISRAGGGCGWGKLVALVNADEILMVTDEHTVRVAEKITTAEIPEEFIGKYDKPKNPTKI